MYLFRKHIRQELISNVIDEYIHDQSFNLGGPVPETYNSYSALGITVIASVAPVLSNHYSSFTMIHSITRVYAQIILSVFSWAYLFVRLPQPPK